MQERVERRLGVPWSALDVERFAPGMRTPLLVIHDREDAEVPWQEGALIAQAWPDATLSTTSGLGHRRLLRDPGVVSEAVRFVCARTWSCPPVEAPVDEAALATSAA
jgi:pimeloyl-ACP methyl ester carboxylesterase